MVCSWLADCLTYMSYEDGFAFLIHEIIEQMLSIIARAVIYQRLVNLFGGTITPEVINNLLNEDIKSIGTTNTKMLYIKNMATVLFSGELNLQELDDLSDEQVYNR